ncbi:LysR family transcriptional regulator [Novosphingobium sp. AP12]|uniref:LysR family transcriptional regulator n=1 Tax=Novosphingobium sp. AP12 TaxID=1144305 RepID=UPI000271F68D|nr:LysR family transcriptional regulator [Novosphingobium sp. AP12]EJL24276.1 transcriptional regulator [Novosphingobium sp. AP12]
MEWSDIRIFLAVVREGTMTGAMPLLRLDHSTISRRIARLEREAGAQLFDRAGRRLTLTPEGERLRATAEKLESIILQEVLTLASEQERIVGSVRVGTTEEIGAHYLAPRLAALTAAHPGLEIELVAVPRTFSLASREVDIVITLDRPNKGVVRFKRLIDVEFGVYASDRYFADRPVPTTLDELREETWCGPIKELLFTPELDILPASASDDLNVKYRTTSMSVQLGAAMGGNALTVLPCFMADQVGLARLALDDAIFERTYWLVVHEDLAQNSRVRALMNAIETLVQSDRAIFRPSAGVGANGSDVAMLPRVSALTPPWIDRTKETVGDQNTFSRFASVGGHAA